MVRGIIAAVGEDNVIGLGGDLPWDYPEDMKRFKRVTSGTTIIMGRLTYESLGKPLPNRRNIVITSTTIEGLECFKSIPEALETCEGDVWFIGGSRIFAEAMDYADTIDLTYIPEKVDASDVVRFPKFDEAAWDVGPLLTHENDPRLKRRIFRKP